MARTVIVLAASVLAWTHVVFPIVLIARARARLKPVVRRPIQPKVSVIVAAHNEGREIGQRLDNLASQTYPTECLDVVVASDGSTDDTVAKAAGRHHVRVLDLPRVGKPAALNAAVRVASGEILVFTDANTEFAPNAISALVMPFADPHVGAVAGDQQYVAGSDGAGERGHWALDRILKQAESAGGSAVSATGAIYAIRRELVDDVPSGVTDDFFISTGSVSRGYRLVFEPDAVARERVAPGDRSEYSRKVRIITQGLTALVLRRSLFDVRRHGFYSLQLLTHKVLRRLSVLPLLAMALATAAGARNDRWMRLLLVPQALIYGLGALGIASGSRAPQSRLIALPTFLCLSNAAALHALVNVLRGRRIAQWEPTHVIRED